MSSEKRKQKEFADLYGPLERLLIYSRTAFDIVANYKYLENLGSKTLTQNMKYCKDTLKLPPFDLDNPYEEYDSKNKYFSATNDLCQYSLWRHLLYDLAEKYYQKMLENIRKFEKDNEYNHNKGMVYANLGISQAAQLKIDQGFANILKALDEDRGYLGKGKKPAEEFFKSSLFRQLEKLIVIRYFETQINNLRKDCQVCPNAYDFLNSLTDPDQRIFFEYTYVKIVQNHEVWKDKPNRFSANRMIAYLQDMCLFAEDFLKRKGYEGMLKDLIRCAFHGIDLSGCSTDSYEELNRKLEQYYEESNRRDRSLRMLLTLRNFSSHNISAGEPTDFVLKHFYKVFDEILRAIFHIYQLRPPGS